MCVCVCVCACVTVCVSCECMSLCVRACVLCVRVYVCVCACTLLAAGITCCIVCHACRKKYHPVAEKFYYEIVEGWAKGVGFWHKPVQLKYLRPPRDDIPTHTPDLRRYQVSAR